MIELGIVMLGAFAAFMLMTMSSCRHQRVGPLPGDRPKDALEITRIPETVRREANTQGGCPPPRLLKGQDKLLDFDFFPFPRQTVFRPPFPGRMAGHRLLEYAFQRIVAPRGLVMRTVKNFRTGFFRQING